jgi:response regulator of citrate/malate metabolism
MGATDYLVKPVRVQECKAFTSKMKKRQLISKDSNEP